MKKNMKTVLFVIIAFGVLILCILGIFLISNKHYYFKLADMYSFIDAQKNYKEINEVNYNLKNNSVFEITSDGYYNSFMNVYDSMIKICDIKKFVQIDDDSVAFVTNDNKLYIYNYLCDCLDAFFHLDNVSDITYKYFGGVYTGDCSSNIDLIVKIDNQDYVYDYENKDLILFKDYLKNDFIQLGAYPVCDKDVMYYLDYNRKLYWSIDNEKVLPVKKSGASKELKIDYIINYENKLYVVADNSFYSVNLKSGHIKRLGMFKNIYYNIDTYEVDINIWGF